MTRDEEAWSGSEAMDKQVQCIRHCSTVSLLHHSILQSSLHATSCVRPCCTRLISSPLPIWCFARNGECMKIILMFLNDWKRISFASHYILFVMSGRLCFSQRLEQHSLLKRQCISPWTHWSSYALPLFQNSICFQRNFTMLPFCMIEVGKIFPVMW